MYYFASDMHLGNGTAEECRRRERLFCSWLDKVAIDAKAIFIVGDMLDFWWEYRRVVPKGFVRTFGKLAELTDRGIEIHYFVGNHDMWQHDYLTAECGITLHFDREIFDLYGRRVSVVHGDDICAETMGGATRAMNRLFRSRAARWAFQHLVHPDAGLRFGQNWSSGSRKSKAITMEFDALTDPMARFAMAHAESERVDYYIFGHNHCTEDLFLPKGSRALFLGQWFTEPVYAALDASGEITIKRVEQ